MMALYCTVQYEGVRRPDDGNVEVVDGQEEGREGVDPSNVMHQRPPLADTLPDAVHVPGLDLREDGLG